MKIKNLDNEPGLHLNKNKNPIKPIDSKQEEEDSKFEILFKDFRTEKPL